MRTINIFLVLMLIAVSTASFSTAKKPSKLLVGTWNVESVDLSEMMSALPEDQREMYQVMKPMMEDLFKSMVMTFKKDGTMNTKITFMDEESSDDGTWALSADGKTITSTANGNSNEIKIIEMSKFTMKISLEAEGMKIGLDLKKK